MHRFFLFDSEISLDQQVDLSPLQHQLSRVLRLKPGARISLLDGANTQYVTEIIRLDRYDAVGLVLSRQTVGSEPSSYLTLYQCSLKADKFEWVLQKGTELGVASFVPVISQRSVVRPGEALLKKYERWRTIIREAAEQSGRGRLPILRDPLSFAEAVEDATGSRCLAWEEAGRLDVCSLGQTISQQGEKSISLMIGPEGGCTADEAEAARVAGWQVVTLGPRILRAETAALAGITIVLERLAEFQYLASCHSERA